MASEAHEISEKEKKKTVAPEHVVQAVQARLGLARMRAAAVPADLRRHNLKRRFLDPCGAGSGLRAIGAESRDCSKRVDK